MDVPSFFWQFLFWTFTSQGDSRKEDFNFGVACLNDKAAARANGMSESWIVRRVNEMYHIAMSHVVVQIRNLCMSRSYRFAEGPARSAKHAGQ